MTVPTPDSPYDEAQRFLYGRINYERSSAIPYRSRTFRLDRMRRLMARLGNPESAVRAIHVAGTKGKGSTAVLLDTMLRAAGQRTGLYTSPHLERIEERFVVNGVPIAPERFLALTERIRPVVERMDREAAATGARGPTFFEITTALAFGYFAEERVDTAVLEVGMGGRLDSTNVCHPAITVITSISFDHTRQLGNTLSQIAREKAGIIKSGIPVVTGVRADEPLSVIREVAAGHGAPLFELGTHFHVVPAKPRSVKHEDGIEQLLHYRETVAGKARELTEVGLAIPGEHQLQNAGVALATMMRLRDLGWSLPDEALREGIAQARIPARIEFLSRQPYVIVDVAHNVASIDALVRFVAHRFPGRRRTMVFAASQDKDIAGMLRVLLPQCEHCILTQFTSNPRSAPPHALAATANRLAAELGLAPRWEVVADPWQAWRRAREGATLNDVICVTGSFFLVAELRGPIRHDVSPVLSAASSSG